LLKVSEETLGRLILLYGARLNNVASKEYRIWYQFRIVQSSRQVFKKAVYFT